MQLQRPKLHGKTEKEQIAELKSYLVQLVDELQFGLSDIEREILEIKTKQKEK